jgi:predicted NUDIX family NTP pyrophosphohydrolase
MKISAGILMYRLNPELEVFLAHPGGPFFHKKDNGYWSIPKGEINENENKIDAAVREFEEETGIKADINSLVYLKEVVQRSGKLVHAWAWKNDFNGEITSNFVEHPQYGKFPEIDKAQYFSVEEAKKKMNSAQVLFIERLQKKI